MRERLFFPARLAALMMACMATVQAAEPPTTWVLRGNRLLAAPDATPVDKGVVVMRGGKIVAAGPSNEVAVPADAREAACGSGGVITAGFQNSHVHFLGGPFADAARRPPEALEAAVSAMLTRYGFTTVVDTASDRDNTLALRTRIEAGALRGPRILTVGLPLFPPKGLPFYAQDLPPPLLDPAQQPGTPAQAAAAVAANLQAGADGTKLFIATPQGDGSIKRIPAAIALAASDETHRRGKLVMAHPTDLEGLRAALAAQVDVLVHTTLDGEATWPDSVVRQMVAARMSVVPTLQLWRYELARQQVPEAIQQRLVAAALAQLKAFSDAGGDVLFGTDVGYMSDFDPADEYRLMAQAGLTPRQILASLTTAPAARWNEGARRGRVAAGLDADLVVLDGDPLADVAAFAKPRCVIRGGAVIYPR